MAANDEGVQRGDPSILPFEGQHADFFRSRKIVRVTAEARSGRRPHVLKIFSRLKVAQTKIAELTRLFDAELAESSITLQVDVSKPFKVDQKVQCHGRFEPVRRHGGRLACGSSVGLGNQRNAGTLTALATSEQDSEHLYGISCNHVVGGCSTARPGTPIVVPGIQDVSSQHAEIHLIGDHFAAAPMSQGLPSVSNISTNRDLACFELREPGLVTSMQGSGDDAYDTPVTFAKVQAGLAVQKWGRSTGLTRGRISNVIYGEPVEYNVTSYYGPVYSQVFKGTVYFKEIYEVEGRPFSLGGDSGALVVTRTAGDEKVVGIVIAGSQQKSLVLPLKPALDVLKLSLVSGHNV